MAENDAEAAASLHFRVAPQDEGERLDRALALAASNAGLTLSRSRAKALIEAGAARVDGASGTPSQSLRAGQIVALALPEPEPAEPLPEAIPLDVLYEDAHLLVLDKPAGLVVHPGAGHGAGTLVNALLAHCGESLSGVGGVRRPGIVHRLDKDTSGLMVVAKTDLAHQGLARLFADHGRTLRLEREYVAYVWGRPARAAGVVDAPLARHAAAREKIAIVAEGAGRRAVTHWRLEEALGREASAVRCRLETGRTHQIRVHMASLKLPLLGDPVYGQSLRSKAGKLGPRARAALEALGRQALHARALGFDHPVTGEKLDFSRDPPQDMLALAAALRDDS
ncbi:RluA family pseudouridine synthase [Methylocella sp.]|uniref:RluA family pseudouridine synthase n=1 Tax=Methylocella sp. TaxID=1978226 RepID=UPI0035B15F03